MIDKIWYDWQHKSPRNELAYGGGSVGPYANYATFSSFPSGLPPFLGVSARSDLKRVSMMTSIRFFLPPSLTARFQVTACGMGFKFGT